MILIPDMRNTLTCLQLKVGEKVLFNRVGQIDVPVDIRNGSPGLLKILTPRREWLSEYFFRFQLSAALNLNKGLYITFNTLSKYVKVAKLIEHLYIRRLK